MPQVTVDMIVIYDRNTIIVQATKSMLSTHI